MPAFIDWSSLLKWQPSTPPPPLPPPPQHEPPSPAVNDHTASFVTPDSYLVVATVAAVILGAVGTWLLVRRLHPQARPVGPPPSDAQVTARLQNHDDALAALRGELRRTARDGEERLQAALDRQAGDADERTRKAVGARTDAVEGRFQAVLEQRLQAAGARIDAVEGQFQAVLEQRLQAAEARAQAALDARTAALGERASEVEDAVRAKLSKEVFDGLYAAVGRRVEALEGGVRLLDGRQLDQEACGVAQRALGARLDAAEAAARESTTPGRLDALEVGLRAAEGRSRAAAQRLGALEDSVGAVDGRATLLAHDVARGRASLDRLARQVRALPGPDRLRELADDWEARFAALEAHVAGALAEAAVTPPALSWSPLVAQKIEPPAAAAAAATTPPYDRHDFAYPADVTMPPTPSPSDRSRSSHSSRLSSFVGREAPSAIPTPGGASSKRKKIDEAGFKEPTFASLQRLFHVRSSSSSS